MSAARAPLDRCQAILELIIYLAQIISIATKVVKSSCQCDMSYLIIISIHILEFISAHDGADSTTDESDAAAGAAKPIGDSNIQKINFQPSISRRNANRYALQFHRETVKELKAMKELARKPIEFKMRSALEVGCDYFDGYDFPVRPKWSFNMAKEQLDRNENRYFTVEYTF